MSGERQKGKRGKAVVVETSIGVRKSIVEERAVQEVVRSGMRETERTSRAVERIEEGVGEMESSSHDSSRGGVIEQISRRRVDEAGVAIEEMSNRLQVGLLEKEQGHGTSDFMQRSSEQIDIRPVTGSFLKVRHNRSAITTTLQREE